MRILDTWTDWQKQALFLALGLFILVFYAYFRFTHQDPGWYYSFAERLANKLNVNEANAQWSFADVKEGEGLGGFVFPFLQFIFVAIINNDLLGVKILSALTAFFTFWIFFLVLKNRLQVKYYALASLLLLLEPHFIYQVMNRPEMLAALLAIVIMYLVSARLRTNARIFSAFFLGGLLVDIHPISCYMVAGFLLIWFLNNLRSWKVAIAGGLAGIAFIVLLNYLFFGTIGFLQFFLDPKQYMTDHYFPVLEDPLSVIIKRPFVLLRFFAIVLLAGLLLLLLVPVYRANKGLFAEMSFARKLFLCNAVVFFLLSNLFSEGGNGYYLYSMICYLPAIIILYDLIIRHFHGKFRYAHLIYLIPIVFYMGLNLRQANSWVNYDKYFRANYEQAAEKITSEKNLLIRPTFSFALKEKNVTCQPLYLVLLYMYNHSLSFNEALEKKQVDLIAVDEMFLKDADKNEPMFEFSYGEFYKKVNSVRFQLSLLDSMKAANVFDTLTVYKDYYHGDTYFLKIDKNNLHQFNNTLSNE